MREMGGISRDIVAFNDYSKLKGPGISDIMIIVKVYSGWEQAPRCGPAGHMKGDSYVDC